MRSWSLLPIERDGAKVYATVELPADQPLRIHAVGIATPEVTPGTISVIASAPGYMKGFSDAQTVPDGTDLEGLRVMITAGHGISGYVRLKTGEPVAQAQLAAQVAHR